jgi:hypothetical protein
MMNHVQKATLHSASSLVYTMEKSLVLAASPEAARTSEETTLNKFGEGDGPSGHWDNCLCVGPLSGSEIEEATKRKTQQQAVLYCSTISGQDANSMTPVVGFARPPQSATEEHQQESSQHTTRSQHDHPRSRHVVGNRCTFEGKQTRRHAALSIVDLTVGETCHPEIAASVHFTGRKSSSYHHDQQHPHIRRDLPRHHHSKKIKCAPTGEGASGTTKMYSSSLSPSEQVALARRRARRRASLTSVCEQSCLETQEFFKRNANILGEKSDMEKLTREQQDPAKATSEEQEISLSELAGLFLLSTLLTTATDKGHVSSNMTSSGGDEKQERRRPEELLVEGLCTPIRDAAYRSRIYTA